MGDHARTTYHACDDAATAGDVEALQRALVGVSRDDVTAMRKPLVCVCVCV